MRLQGNYKMKKEREREREGEREKKKIRGGKKRRWVPIPPLASCLLVRSFANYPRKHQLNCYTHTASSFDRSRFFIPLPKQPIAIFRFLPPIVVSPFLSFDSMRTSHRVGSSKSVTWDPGVRCHSDVDRSENQEPVRWKGYSPTSFALDNFVCPSEKYQEDALWDWPVWPVDSLCRFK